MMMIDDLKQHMMVTLFNGSVILYIFVRPNKNDYVSENHLKK